VRLFFHSFPFNPGDQNGFSFPWDGELLLPANKVFGNKRLGVDDDPVRIGRSGSWLMFEIGSWTFLRSRACLLIPLAGARLR